MAPDCGEILQRVEQRQVAFGEVGLFHRPVVHFGVDVVGVLAVPGGLVGIVPEALQVGRLAAGTAGADHQVAAELEEQGDQRGVAAVGEGGDALVGGKLGGGRWRRDRARRGGRGPGDRGCARRGGRRRTCLPRAASVASLRCRGVGGDVLVVLEVGGGGQNEGGVGVPSLAARVEAGVEADGGILHLAGHGGAAFAVGVAALQRGGERGGLAGRQVHDDRVGRMAGEDFAAVRDAVGGELGGGDAGVQIERALVVGRVLGAGGVDDQVAERLVGLAGGSGRS